MPTPQCANPGGGIALPAGSGAPIARRREESRLCMVRHRGGQGAEGAAASGQDPVPFSTKVQAGSGIHARTCFAGSRRLALPLCTLDRKGFQVTQASTCLFSKAARPLAGVR
jgi:hypothetical protein